MRGAFSGAATDKEGYVEAAERGTLFLDEVADLSPRSQALLLRILETGEYVRLGEARARRASVRIVSAAGSGWGPGRSARISGTGSARAW